MTQLKAESFITTSTTASDFGSQSFIPPAFQPRSYAGAVPSTVSDGMGNAFIVVLPFGIVAGHHVSLMTDRISNASWEDCAMFATALGGSLPAADEMVALQAMGVTFAGPHWTAERANGDRALAYSFLSGVGGYSHTSNEFNGLVVRREPVAPAGDDVEVPADANAVAQGLLDAELWPEDSEIVAEIRAMFMHNWGMDGVQADARMSRFDFKAALAGVASLEGGAV